ncbi:MAG: hypothetical protein HDR05_12460 [Lachnospiraceae bacterium]|nr:hypothetical protein [Lachnospiraceae bacterium]
MNDTEIATEAAVRIINTLIYNKGISVEKLFNFLNSNPPYREFLNDDNTLICMMHDDSLDKFIDMMGEALNE